MKNFDIVIKYSSDALSLGSFSCPWENFHIFSPASPKPTAGIGRACDLEVDGARRKATRTKAATGSFTALSFSKTWGRASSMPDRQEFAQNARKLSSFEPIKDILSLSRKSAVLPVGIP